MIINDIKNSDSNTLSNRLNMSITSDSNTSSKNHSNDASFEDENEINDNNINNMTTFSPVASSTRSSTNRIQSQSQLSQNLNTRNRTRSQFQNQNQNQNQNQGLDQNNQDQPNLSVPNFTISISGIPKPTKMSRKEPEVWYDPDTHERVHDKLAVEGSVVCAGCIHNYKIHNTFRWIRICDKLPESNESTSTTTYVPPSHYSNPELLYSFMKKR